MSSRSAQTHNLRRILRISLMVGAATEDARALGLSDALKAELAGPLAEFRTKGRARGIVLSLHAILGPNWVPTGLWADQILLLAATPLTTLGADTP